MTSKMTSKLSTSDRPSNEQQQAAGFPWCLSRWRQPPTRRPNVTDLGKLLTGQQRLVVLRSWPLLVGEFTSMSQSTMLGMLAMEPDVQYLFSFADKDTSELLQDIAFRVHACRMIAGISCLMENIDSTEDTVAEMLRDIGEAHGRIPNFKSTYFEMLPDIYSKAWESHLKDRYTPTAKKAWNTVFNYLIAVLKEGGERAKCKGSTPNIAGSKSSVAIPLAASFAEHSESVICDSRSFSSASGQDSALRFQDIAEGQSKSADNEHSDSDSDDSTEGSISRSGSNSRANMAKATEGHIPDDSSKTVTNVMQAMTGLLGASNTDSKQRKQ